MFGPDKCGNDDKVIDLCFVLPSLIYMCFVVAVFTSVCSVVFTMALLARISSYPNLHVYSVVCGSNRFSLKLMYDHSNDRLMTVLTTDV